MNEGHEKTNNRLMKTLAVLGFAVIIIFLVWLAIQLVSLIPGAFSSLASLAEDVNNRDKDPETIVIETEGSVSNSSESFSISWNDNKKRGHYALQYECVEGVSLDIRLPSGAVVPVSCGESYQLPSGVRDIDMAFASEKERFSEVTYSISFVPEGQHTATISTEKLLTIVNPSIPPDGLVAGEDDSDQEPENEVEDKDDEETSTPAPTTPETRYRYVYKTTYKTPVSDPNGYTELAVTYMGVGVVNNAGQFVPKSRLDTDDFGAFQFKVKNIGTKTSGTWLFEAELPTDATYDSKIQESLKPNEEALITVVFGRGSDEGTQRFGVEINGGNDLSSANNEFTSTIRIDD